MKLRILLLLLALTFVLSGCFASQETDVDVSPEELEEQGNEQEASETNGTENDEASTDEGSNNGDSKEKNDNDTSKNNNSSDNTTNEENKNNDNKKASDGKVTEERAIQLVREYLDIVHAEDIHVVIDRSEDGKYVAWVFETVQTQEGSRSQTYGWYYVDKETGEVEDMF